MSEANHSEGLRIASLPKKRPERHLWNKSSKEFLGHTCIPGYFKANPTSFHTSLLLVDGFFSFCDRFDLLVGGHLTPSGRCLPICPCISPAKQLWYLQILQLLWKKPAVCATPVPMGNERWFGHKKRWPGSLNHRLFEPKISHENEKKQSPGWVQMSLNGK